MCTHVVILSILGLGDSTIVIHCCDSRSTIVMMIVLFTIAIVVDMIFEYHFCSFIENILCNAIV